MSLKKGAIYIFFSTILFSSMEIVLKLVSSNFNPLQITLSRFLVGGLVLLPFAIIALKKKQIKLTTKDIGYFSLLGLICVVISMIFYQLGVINTKASVVGVLFSCNPIFVMFLAYFILKEPITKYNTISLILEIVGILIIINPFNTNLSVKGIVFTLLAAITFAIYGVLGKRKCLKYSSLVVTCFSFILGSIELLILITIARIDFISTLLINNSLEIFTNVHLLTGYTLNNILPMLYIFIGVTGLGYAFYFKAMEETTANTASLIFFFKPMLSPILALVILKEVITINMAIGVLFILIGSLTSILPNMLKKHNSTEPIEITN